MRFTDRIEGRRPSERPSGPQGVGQGAPRGIWGGASPTEKRQSNIDPPKKGTPWKKHSKTLCFFEERPTEETPKTMERGHPEGPPRGQNHSKTLGFPQVLLPQEHSLGVGPPRGISRQFLYRYIYIYIYIYIQYIIRIVSFGFVSFRLRPLGPF